MYISSLIYKRVRVNPIMICHFNDYIDLLNTLETMYLNISIIVNKEIVIQYTTREMAQVERLTRDRWIPVSREFEARQRPRCFLEQETFL